MDNKLRIKRVKEGIKLLEKGIDPCVETYQNNYWLMKYLGISNKCSWILYANTVMDKECSKYGFKSGPSYDLKAMLHNWKVFLKLIEKL